MTPATLPDLTHQVLAGQHGPPPAEITATSVFWLHHGTRLAGAATSCNQYMLVRAGQAFGACAFEPGEIDPSICADASGSPLDGLLRHGPGPLRTAALDAYLGNAAPHHSAAGAQPVVLPAGAPEVRARARDDAVARLLDVTPRARVALIGVVNPLVAAIRARGAEPLPCDRNLHTTQRGDRVATDMSEVLHEADAVIATGMTLGNGTFDTIIAHCRKHDVPLGIYAQTGAAVAREFLGRGVSALSAEPFPFSQFSAEATTLYLYRASGTENPPGTEHAR